MALPRTSRRVVAASAIVLLLVGCRCQRREQAVAPSVPSAPSGTPPSRAPAAPDLTTGAPPAGTRFATDGRWTRAAGGAAIDLEILARFEGGTGLLEGAETGGTTAVTALRALPFAPDADVAVTRVCDWLRSVPSARSAPFLEAIHGVAAWPPTPTEPHDPTWERRCDAALSAFVARRDVPAAEHDLAVSARQLIGEHRLGM